MRERNRAVQRVIPTPVTTGPVPDNGPDMLPISDDGILSILAIQNLREVFGTITTMIMSPSLLREHSLFHQTLMMIM
jgi:hypothetical protein